MIVNLAKLKALHIPPAISTRLPTQYLAFAVRQTKPPAPNPYDQDDENVSENKSRKFRGSFLRHMELNNRWFNGPLTRKIRRFNEQAQNIARIVNLRKRINKQATDALGYSYKILKNVKTSFGWFSWIGLLLSVMLSFSLASAQKQAKKRKKIFAEQAEQAAKSSETPPQAGLNSPERQELEQLISKIKRIEIYPISIMGTPKFSNEERGEKMAETNKINCHRLQIQYQDGSKDIATPYLGDPNHLLKYIDDIQQKYNVNEKAEIFYKNAKRYSLYNAAGDVLGFLTPLIPIAITLYIFRSSDPTRLLKGISKSAKQSKIEAIKDIKTRFKDVAGMEQAKKQITQFVDFLKNNQRYKEIGAKIPKGALLTGPPGTGKTMLARACAGEAGVSFFYISGSEFVQIFVGLGASKVRDLFASARQNAPSIIFIDQIDAIGKKRQESRDEQKDSTLNQLLVEMDGFASHQTIVVLAATNRKEILDNALTRPGRFDRLVEITLPDVQAREQIFMVHLAPLKIDPNVPMRNIAKRLAELSPGFSGADIANLCNQAAIIATRKNGNFITDKDFEQATERITAGYIKKNLIKEHTRKRVAYHEAGHAVSSWFLKGGDPLVKLTIIPRSKGALGYAQYLPKTTMIMERTELIDKVAIMLGGITSEEIFFGQMSSGGSDDLQKVYSLTRRMVTQFGMGKQTYNITLDQQSYIQKQSKYLSNKMEDQIAEILDEARKRSRDIIEAKKDVIEALAKELLQKQTLNSDEILKIMGERPDFSATKQSITGKEEVQQNKITL